jgi:hypothetical protein
MHTIFLIIASAGFGLALAIGLWTGIVHSIQRGTPTVVFTRKDTPQAYWTTIAAYAVTSVSALGPAIGVTPSISELLAWLLQNRPPRFQTSPLGLYTHFVRYCH